MTDETPEDAAEETIEDEGPWDPPLADPNSKDWFPRQHKRQTLKQAFYERCLGVEEILLLRAAVERRMNVDNFDSGPGFEDILREELARLLPDRYSVRAGTVSDAEGRSAGDCDVVLFNSTWFPAIKAGATESSRKWHYPIDGVYGVIEAKQSLNVDTLEEAMRKLVKVSRLRAFPSPSFNRVVENRAGGFEDPDDSGRVFTAVVAGGVNGKADINDLVHRFIAINGQLPRVHMVNALVVLGQAYVCWATTDPATGHDVLARHSIVDDELPLYAAFFSPHEGKAFSALYQFTSGLLSHLTGTVLFAHGTARKYGAQLPHQIPVTRQWDMWKRSEASPDLDSPKAYREAAKAFERAERAVADAPSAPETTVNAGGAREDE